MAINGEDKLKKLEEIDRTLEEIKGEVTGSDKPLFIELIGTPKSGKTTLKNAIQNAFDKKGIPVITRRETAEYNPIPKSSEHYNFWMILELMKNISEDFANAKGKVVIYDRGLIDRIPWMKSDISQGKMSQEDYGRIIEMYQSNYLKGYKPITQVFFTSPQLSILRKGSEGRFVNNRTLITYNSILNQELDTVRNMSSRTNITVTDQYQGRIKDFLIDQMAEISRDLKGEIDKKVRVKTADIDEPNL